MFSILWVVNGSWMRVLFVRYFVTNGGYCPVFNWSVSLGSQSTTWGTRKRLKQNWQLAWFNREASSVFCFYLLNFDFFQLFQPATPLTVRDTILKEKKTVITRGSYLICQKEFVSNHEYLSYQAYFQQYWIEQAYQAISDILLMIITRTFIGFISFSNQGVTRSLILFTLLDTRSWTTKRVK